ncbi:glycosyltransferase family 2 protein [Cerasicoccus arenae]|uniref:glycosyltransferase family 2 protein n=1 Tax=Cerasicoccus arenae TaxID=424488 RepID=UPI0016788AE5|nr:glycosyltransferase family 2 protein [Cerasicoccus arenae]MBK1858646.1 glycosyltransferase [Cerasicoccus arenae]
MTKIILSVVIPTFNSAQYLVDCLDSVAREATAGVEFILVDGASSDETLDICKRYRDVLDVIMSEPDSGQSEAFNKGFRRARGRYFTWLNSDDVICPGSLRGVLDFLSKSDEAWITANTIYLNADGRVIRYLCGGGFEAFAVRLGLLNIFGPSSFIHRDLYQKVGPLNEEMHYCMDAEYWWRIVSSGQRFIRMPIYFWGLRLHDQAKTASAVVGGECPPAMAAEALQIRKQYHPCKSSFARWLALCLVRMYRILNFSLPRSILATLRNRGKSLVNG